MAASPILQNSHLAYARRQFGFFWYRLAASPVRLGVVFWLHLGTIFGPSWAHLGSSWAVLSRLRATLGPLGEWICDCIADFSKFAPRPHETPILRFLVPKIGGSSSYTKCNLCSCCFPPLWGHFGPSWGCYFQGARRSLKAVLSYRIIISNHHLMSYLIVSCRHIVISPYHHTIISHHNIISS